MNSDLERCAACILIIILIGLGGAITAPIVNVYNDKKWQKELVDLEMAHYEIDAKTGVSSFVLHIPKKENK